MERTTIEVRGRLVFDEMRAVVVAAQLGCGLGYVFEQFAAADLRAGRLVTLLDKHCAPSEAFHIYYPSRSQLRGKLRAFIDFIRAANWVMPSQSLRDDSEQLSQRVNLVIGG